MATSILTKMIWQRMPKYANECRYLNKSAVSAPTKYGCPAIAYTHTTDVLSYGLSSEPQKNGMVLAAKGQERDQEYVLDGLSPTLVKTTRPNCMKGTVQDQGCFQMTSERANLNLAIDNACKDNLAPNIPVIMKTLHHMTLLKRTLGSAHTVHRQRTLFAHHCIRTSANLHQTRSLHLSSVCQRKRKNKPLKEAALQDNQQEEWDEETVEDHEYSEEAFEYENELVGRGYQSSQGQRVLVIQPVVKGERGMVHKADCGVMMAEAEALIETLPAWSVVESLRASIKSLSKKHVFGQGTVQDLATQIRSQPDITTVFLNMDRLSGVQKRTLEEEWGVPVMDRYEVVLQIFKEHASTKEAKLQIALAELQFRRIHLKHEDSDLDQQSGAQQYIGGGGETLLEKKQRQLRDREGAVRRALEKLKRKRGLLRQGREKKHFPHVAVVGYTNAGKTSLIKALTGDSKLQPLDRLFATLDVTSHAGLLTNRMPVIYIDTVGFISDLPHQLIASFAATLEDVLCADLILHVRDSSHPEAEAQRCNVLSVLHDLGVSDSLLENMIEVNNKVDLTQTSPENSSHDGFLPVSAILGTGLDRLKEVIEAKVFEVTDRVRCEVCIPQSGAHLGWLYKEATVQEVSTIEGDAEHLMVDAVFSQSAYSKFRAMFGDCRPA